MENSVFVIHRVKRAQTIFTKQAINEVVRFSQELQALPLWRQLCLRNSEYDGLGCSELAYGNLTAKIEPYLDDDTYDDDMVQALVEGYAETIIDEGHSMIEKTFTPEYPYSRFLLSYFRVSAQAWESNIVDGQE